MPATEQTWYDQKLLHVVFGATSIILLISTVWMFAADHDREWKGYQRTFRRTEERLTSWRKSAEQSADYQATIAQLEAQLLEERAKALPGEAYANFKAEVARDADRRGAKPETFDKSDQEAMRLEQESADAKAKQAAAAKASQTVNAAWERVAELKTAQADANEIAQAEEAAHQAEQAALAAESEASIATKQAAKTREKLVQRMEKSITLARAREDDLASRRKFRSADLDKARADLDIMVRDSKFDEMEAQQGVIDVIAADLDQMTRDAQAAAAHRVQLAGMVKSIQDAELNLNKEIDDHQAQVNLLESKLDERGLSYVNNFLPGKKFLTIPILDAFNSPLTIDNLWTENLTISNGSFGQVRRFDRCTTCHRGIAKTAAGSATQPAYVPEREVRFVLETPAEAPQPVTERGETVAPDLFSVYGFRLADQGLINPNDVTVDYVKPTSLSATAIVAGNELPGDVEYGFEVGDVILEINGDKVLDAADVRQLLFEGIKWGQTVNVKVRRGFPQPYSSHPRLDLFVGSLSPHKLSVFGCTSCHEGQGSATDFKWASHYPNDPRQMKEWTREHGWFNNHHWIFPMYPERFAESACLKCHHDVTELEPSERFPDPPAPKVVHGFHLIAEYGCFTCHEINGYDGPDKRIGPDMRLEPNYYAAAAALKADPAFKDLSPSAVPEADRLIQHPDEDEVRHALRDLVLADRYSDTPKLTPESHKMADVLQDTDTPGTYRKVGPTLRYVASKLGNEFMYDWIRKPKHFRPSTKMPQFFGLWDHLQGDPQDLEKAQAYERAEILGTVRYLMTNSQEFDYLDAEQGTAAASPERGKIAFEIRGCLACHQHEDFPAAESDQGPNLTGLGDKFAGSPDAQRWMYSWLKQPTHYSARTKMPNLYLDPYEDKDGSLVDPAADITAYLLGSSTGWKPGDDVADDLKFDTQAEATALDGLVLEYLEAAFSKKDAQTYLETGIPAQLKATLKGAEVELVGGASSEQKLMYIGRKTIAKYGCYACHDIPGFEDAKPIGAALADWGRKESSKLAFEHIAEYLHEGHGTAHGSSDDHGGDAATHDDHAAHAEAGHHADTGMEGHDEPFDDSFYMYQISQLDRSGFIWQKLTEPRSYDYKKTRNKGYNEKLRMPLFPLNPEEREAVVTFVLGLVAEPPAPEFVYQGDDRQQAINEGWAVIQKFNFAGCHMFEAEQWDIEFADGDIREPNAPEDYPFVAAHMGAAALEQSARIDPKRGVLHATLRGVQALRNADALPDVLDGEGDPIEPEDLAYFDENHPEFDPDEYILPLQYPFELWKPAAIEGQTYDVGMMRLTIPETMIKRKRPAVGGDLARLLLPRVLELEKQDNPAANGTETWGWVPPPLLGEGQKVKPDWLYDFMLNPYPIRPAVFLRMPKFNLSPEDARKIVNYFAAKDNANYPFEYSHRSQLAELDAMNAEFEAIHDTTESRFEHAMKIVTNSNYCIKCHLIGDYEPEGSVRALAPDLSMSQARLRPGYTRKWIAKPTSILPYTPMPVNIPYAEGVSQELYPGTSTEQIDGLVDLLMNYSHYTNQQTDVRALVEAAARTEPTPDDSADAEALAPASGAE